MIRCDGVAGGRSPLEVYITDARHAVKSFQAAFTIYRRPGESRCNVIVEGSIPLVPAGDDIKRLS